MSESVVKADSLREVFGKALVENANPDRPNFWVLGVDLAGGAGSHHFREKFADRHIELGIAEQAAMGVAAGLASSTGLPVYLPGFATFLMRGWEVARLAIFHDRRNVRLAMSHLGLSAGPDGSSVQETSHIAAWRSLPHATVVWPADAAEMRAVVKWSLTFDGPVVILTGRNPVPHFLWPDYRFELGKPQVVYPFPNPSPFLPNVTLIGCGHTVAPCIEAANLLGNGYGIECQVVNLSTLKPLNGRELWEMTFRSGPIIVVEDHAVWGGAYGAVCEALAPHGFRTPVIPVGLTSFGESGEPDELAAKYGLDAAGIARAVLEALA